MDNKKQQNGKIYVEREIYEKNDKKYYTYYLKGEVRGKAVKASLAPPDKGGYTVLDIVFGNEMQAELTQTPYEIKDESTGRVIRGNTYGVRSYDESGEVYECAVKPFRPSDKAILNMLLR